MQCPRGLLWAFCFMAALSLAAQTQEGLVKPPPKVVRIELKHVGPPAASDSLILANIRVKAGEPYLPISVDDDVRSLYATGYFKNIRVNEEATEEGVKLVYVLQGKLLLTDIKIVGNKELSTSKLKKKITSKVGEPLDDQKVFLDAQELQKLYQKSGYQKTKVEAKITPDENTGRGVATFDITEAPKVTINSISFEGAAAFTQKKLRKQLKTRNRWMFSWLTGSGVLKDDEFEDDKDKLIEFYQSRGYIDFEIKDVKFNYLSPTKLDIVIVITEGKPYKVGALTLKGNTKFTTDEITRGTVIEGKSTRLSMLVGDIFTPGGLRADVEGIRDYYGSRGFVDVRIFPIKKPNVDTGTMDLDFEIQENEKAYIEKIEIKGNYKTKDRVIRRELAVAPGEVFDTVRIKLSKMRLEGLRYFEKIDSQPEDTDIANRKNLVIGLEEKNTGTFTMGAGLSSVDSIVGFAEIAQGNFDLFHPPTFTGGGQKLRLRVSIGTEQEDYLLSFIEPWFLQRKLSLQTDLYHRDLQYQSDIYDEKHTGTTISLMRALGSDFLIGRLGYTFEQVKLDLNSGYYGPKTVLQNVNGRDQIITIAPGNVSPQIQSQMGDYLVSKVFGSLAYDTRGGGPVYNKGQRTELLGELAGGALGGDTEFYKLEAKSGWYFKGLDGFFPETFHGHSLEVVGRAGVIQQFGESTSVPLFERWYLGGLYSLRGFKYRDVGPKDEFNQPLGGSTYFFGSMEYSFPIIERLRLALFYDIGNVFSDPFSFVTDPSLGQTVPYSDNWGIGLRINLPIGPLRLDYGIPIHHDANVKGSGRIQFGVGYTRDF